MEKIKILTGSTRPNRFNIQPANWLVKLAEQSKDIEVTLLDLAKIKLPFLDEPIQPSKRKYTKEHTKNWSVVIDEADGFIFVTPEYNHGISPVLKNAVDYLWYEWHYKPVSFVSYGGRAGGSRAVEQWRAISAGLKMYDLSEQLMIPRYWENMDENGDYLFTADQEDKVHKIMEDLAFWAKIMKSARKELQC